MLYIVATPIGNLKDITLRAVEVLKAVDKIYCEDTRRTRILLQAHGITTPTDSYHHHSDHKIPSIVRELKQGLTIAYVSDAGTPGVADPVGKLVEAVRTAGIPISPIPGPSAVTALLSVTGRSANQYRFLGYVPTKKGRQTFVKSILDETVLVVCFETAPRLRKFLSELTAFGGSQRKLVIGRELTKQFEEVLEGTTGELQVHFNTVEPRGEFAIVVTP